MTVSGRHWTIVWGWTAAAAVASSIAADARADAAGDKVLAAVDEATNRATTSYAEYDVVNQEAGKAETHGSHSVRRKAGKQLLEMIAPAELKGTKVLFLSPTETYVYLPSFGKVRRLTAAAAREGFLGLTFSSDDLAPTRLGDRYTATIASDDPTQVKIVATPKAGQTVAYAKIEITVAKDKMLPTRLEYYDAAGKPVKTEERTGTTCQGNVCAPGEVKMTNAATGSWTRLVRKAWKVNEAISDDVFTKRNLAE